MSRFSKLPSLHQVVQVLFVVGFILLFVAVVNLPEISLRDQEVGGTPLHQIKPFGIALGKNLRVDTFVWLGLLAICVFIAFRIILVMLRKRSPNEPPRNFQRASRILFSAIATLIIGMLVYACLNAKVDPERQDVYAKTLGDKIITMRYSNDLGKIVGGSANGKAYVWGSNRGQKPMQLIPRFQSLFTKLAYAPSGDLLAVGAQDGTIRLMSVDGQQIIRLLKQNGNAITALTFSNYPYLLKLAVGYSDGSVALWQMGPTGEDAIQLWEKKQHDLPVDTLAFDPTEQFLATGAQDHAIRILSAVNGNRLVTPEVHPDKLIGLSFMQVVPGKLVQLSALSEGGIVTSYEYRVSQQALTLKSKNGEEHLNPTFDGATTAMRAVDFNPNAQIYITARQDGRVDIRPYIKGCSLARIPHASAVNTLAMDRSGTYLATGDEKGNIQVWNLSQWRAGTCARPVEFVASAAHHQEITANKDRQVKDIIWNNRSGVSMLAITNVDKSILICKHVLPNEKTTCNELQGPRDDIVAVSFGFQPDGDAWPENLVITASRDGYVRAMQPNSDGGFLVGEMGWMDAPINLLVPRPKSTQVAVGNTRGELRLWNTSDSSYQENDSQHQGEISAIAFNAAGTLWATGDQDGNLTLWRTPDFTQPLTLVRKGENGDKPAHDQRITALAFSSDGKLLASASTENSKNIQLWRLSDFGLEQTLTAPAMSINHLVFTPDAKNIAVAGETADVLVLPLDGSTPMAFDAHVKPIMALQVAPSQQLVAAGVDGNEIKEWNVAELQTLTVPGTANWAESAVLGNPTLRFLIAACIPFLGFLGFLWYGNRRQADKIAKFVFQDYPNYDRDSARDYVVNTMEGKAPLTITLRDGSFYVAGQKEGMSPPLIAGPGNLKVPEGYVVVIERDGVVSRIVEAGVHFLEKGERPTMAIPLYVRTNVVTVENVLTRDQMLFQKISVTVRHRVAGVQDLRAAEMAEQAKITANTPTQAVVPTSQDSAYRYKADNDVIHYRVWNPEHKDYFEILAAYLTKELHALVGSEYFEDLYSGFGGTRLQVQNTLQTRVKTFMLTRGVEVESVALTQLQLEDRIMKALQDRKHLELDRQVKLARAQIKRDSLVIQQDAKASLRDALIRQIADPLRDKGRGVIIDAEIAVRYIEAIERLSLTFVREDLEAERQDTIDGVVKARDPNAPDSLNGKIESSVPTTEPPPASPPSDKV